MNSKARHELIAMIIGMILIIGGVFYFISKIKMTSVFFSPDETWPLWASILCMLPLLAGIVTMIIWPRKWVPRMVGIAGAIFLIVMICEHTVLRLQTRLEPYEWLILGTLLIGGIATVIVTLFARRKDQNEQR